MMAATLHGRRVAAAWELCGRGQLVFMKCKRRAGKAVDTQADKLPSVAQLLGRLTTTRS